jgi:hypothetical protein
MITPNYVITAQHWCAPIIWANRQREQSRDRNFDPQVYPQAERHAS